MGTIREELATARQERKEFRSDIGELKELVKDMKTTLDELTGTKKFLVWFTGAIATAVTTAIAWITFNRG